MICTALTTDTTTRSTNNSTTTSSAVPPSTSGPSCSACKLRLGEHQGRRPGDLHHGDPLARLDHLRTVERPRRPLVVADADASTVPVDPRHDRGRAPDQRLRAALVG